MSTEQQQKKPAILVDLNAKDEFFAIDGKNPAFEGTPFEGLDFSIKARNLSRTEIAAINQRHSKYVRGQKRLDDSAFGIDIFVEAVQEWSGFGDPAGNPLPCTEETKRSLANKYWGLASAISAAVLDEQDRRAVSREEATKN